MVTLCVDAPAFPPMSARSSLSSRSRPRGRHQIFRQAGTQCQGRAEGIENKPAFRKAFERRRCLVPVDNFYEWRKTEIGKQPYALALADRGIMALAGVWVELALAGG